MGQGRFSLNHRRGTPVNTPLKKIRTSLAKSTYEMAKVIGINQSQYYRVEAGQSKASPALAKKIAEIFEGQITRDEILFPELHVSPEKKKPSRSIRTAEAL